MTDRIPRRESSRRLGSGQYGIRTLGAPDSLGFSSNIRMNKADKCYIFLTPGAREPIVRGVILRLRHLIASALVVALIAASVPRFVCTPAACAANVECKYAHCACCGPNCPWQKSSQKSQKHDNCCNEQCPLIAASKAVTISNERPFAAALLGFGEAQPFLFGSTYSRDPLIHQSANLHPQTLLSLACALTI
jgi:hypothetical protein